MVEPPPPSARSFIHRRYLVDRRFQFKYTALVVLLSSAVYALFAYQLYQLELARTEMLILREGGVRHLVSAQDRTLLHYLVGFFVLQAASLVVLGILVTHRIAGPIHRVRTYLEEAAKGGELKPLDPVRSRDEFREFFEALSAFIERFRK